MEANQPSSQDYLELEMLLSRIESSATHYELLAIPQSASVEAVTRAYTEALALFRVCYSATDETWASALRERADQSLRKLTDAFTVLSNYGKRVEYDNLNTRRRIKPLKLDISIPPAPQSNSSEPIPESSEDQPGFIRDSRSVVLPDKEEPARRIPGRTSPYSISAAEKVDQNRRRVTRMSLSIPAYVAGHDREEGKWREVARTRDVSRFGAAILIRRRLRQGIVIHLSLPLPVKLRNHGFADSGYNTFAIVRRVGMPEDGVRLVGVEFLGERAPEGYLAKPWGIFETSPWNGPDRRRSPREKSNERMGVEYLDESKAKIGEEIGLAENVSAGGLRMKVQAAPACFDYIRITRLSDGRQSLASVCQRFIGEDQMERLCMSYIETT